MIEKEEIPSNWGEDIYTPLIDPDYLFFKEGRFCIKHDLSWDVTIQNIDYCKSDR